MSRLGNCPCCDSVTMWRCETLVNWVRLSLCLTGSTSECLRYLLCTYVHGYGGNGIPLVRHPWESSWFKNAVLNFVKTHKTFVAQHMKGMMEKREKNTRFVSAHHEISNRFEASSAAPRAPPLKWDRDVWWRKEDAEEIESPSESDQPTVATLGT